MKLVLQVTVMFPMPSVVGQWGRMCQLALSIIIGGSKMAICLFKLIEIILSTN
jgi:hypothetical protein